MTSWTIDARQLKTNPLANIHIDYETEEHVRLPHVVKFSGGRSSGAMLFSMLEQGLLNRERGDVVVFNNTSAEHLATYDFVRKCTEYSEGEFGIPFFWIEFATYEDAGRGVWTRLPTFRMVNTQPKSNTNVNGFHWRGEVFEELVSHQGFLPSRHTRICTMHLKLATTYRFLAEWFAVKNETSRRGHYEGTRMVTDDSLIKKHRESRGVLSDGELLRKREFVRQQNYVREAQKFNDFSSIGSSHLQKTGLVEYGSGLNAPMRGEDSIEYVSLIGLRADEPIRVARVKQRNYLAVDASVRRANFMADGEIIGTPLADSSISNKDILNFWNLRPWQLELPSNNNLSNCVYCFMKGSRAIRTIADNIASVDKSLPRNLRSVRNTPTDIDWWVEIEEKYQRRPDKRSIDSSKGENSKVIIGFWGVDAPETYRTLRDMDPEDIIATDRPSTQPCDCTE